MSKLNLELLGEAARLLSPLLGELVFVGGSTTALLITDKAAAEVRPTYDVDAIAEISSYAAYADFSERLRRCGFSEDVSEGAPICRWRLKKTILDVMPLDEKILGFSNRWYKPAMDSAVVNELEPGLRVRVVTAVYFCVTKLEAFAGRGKHDYQSSHDLEDLMAVVDGRPELAEEIRSGPEDARAYIRAEFRKLLATPEFLDALPGYLLPDQASQARVSILLERLRKIETL
ncbi:MAG TPA: hypothetical protein VMB66_00840 [Candidatus Acidoferrales bacterium]|nr:hypothetical protein [Candidatus Acidoferrales bacterium]